LSAFFYYLGTSTKYRFFAGW